jgi:hypothetical protein
LGATLLHLFHGTALTLRDRLVAWTPPIPGDVRAAALDRVIASCLHPVAARRPDAHQLLERLRSIIAEAGGTPLTALATDGNRRSLPPDSSPLAIRARLPDVDREATTVHGREVPPAIVADVPAARRRWLVPAVVSLAVIIAGGLVVFTADRSSGAAVPAATTQPATTQADQNVPSITSAVEPERLTAADWSAGEVGDCLVWNDADPARLAVIDCATPHDLQRFAAGALEAFDPLTPLPESSVLEASIAKRCAEAFAGFVGVTAQASELDTAHTRPTPASWVAGDRRYACFLGVNGARVVGDARTSGW